MDALRLSINGRTRVERNVSPNTTLLNYLRNELALTGTKEGCAEGDCGACTVVIVDRNGPLGPSYRAINACLVLLPMVHDKEVFTVEALRDSRTGPHPVQLALVDALGSQCGFCTPGFVMSMFEACYRKDLDEPWKIDDQLAGNLCRCTGYRPIRDATRAIAGLAPDDDFTRRLEADDPPNATLDYAAETQRFTAPKTFEELFTALAVRPQARFVAGGTDLALEITKRFQTIPDLISLERIEALRRLEIGEHCVIGAGVWLSDLETATRARLPAIERMLRFFAARQIKHRATVGGNLCNASPIGDLPPILIALGAEVVLRSAGGTRRLPLEHFFVSYRKTALAAGEILEAVEFPLPASNTRVSAYKVTKRQELDISAVSAGLAVSLSSDGRVTSARFAYGGMAATPARAKATEQFVTGKPWSEVTVLGAQTALEQDFRPIDDHRASGWYRKTVAQNLLLGFFHETQQEASPRLPHRPIGAVAPEVNS